MTTFTKSFPITGFDGNPPIYAQAGQGAGARAVNAFGTVLAGATDATTVVYRMIRLPFDAIVQKVEVAIESSGGTLTTFVGNVGLYWSDNSNDGTPLIQVGSPTAISASFFAYHVDLHSVAKDTFYDVTFQNATGNSATDGFYSTSAAFQPLWVALTSGGFQGVNALNFPDGPVDGLYAGEGATSGSSNTGYQLLKSPGGMVDICFNPTTANSLSAAMNFSMRVTYLYGG